MTTTMTYSVGRMTEVEMSELKPTPIGLSEMTTAELEALKAEVDDKHREAGRLGRPTGDLARFWAAIDNELDRRGA